WRYRREISKARVESRFYDFTEEEWGRMLFSLQKLREASKGKRLTLVLFPIRQDLKRYRPGEKPPLTQRLEAWGREQDVEVIDLVPWLHDYQSDWEPYHLPCDNHYSAFGNRAAFELVQKYY
ncbi:MAG TPA: SGNH/GDSL hydrolase family protein, partial [bacterium]|nr:SGNH/GDSL hydrolase family protein [bacterium]